MAKKTPNGSKMIKATLIILIFFMNYLSAQDGITVADDYKLELDSFLKNNHDLNTQLFGYLIETEFTKSYLVDSKNIVSKTLNSNPNKHTIFLLDNLCHSNSKLTSFCHQHNIHKTHQKIDPENIFSYLFNLHKDDSNENLQKTIVLAAKNSTYSSSFTFNNTLKIADQIDTFLESKPQFIDEHKKKYFKAKNLVKELQLIERGLLSPLFFDTNNTKLHSLSFVLSKEIAILEPLNYISNACKENTIAKPCLEIAKTLQSDKTIMNQLIGSNINSSIIRKQYSESKSKANRELLLSTFKKDKLITGLFMCYNRIKGIEVIASWNINIMTQYIKDSLEFDEIKAAKNRAFRVYNIEKQHGYNPDFNPNECE